MAPKNKLASNRLKITTQKFLDISEIKEDTLIMRDGTLRAILLVSSINFALKSEDEQNAIIAAYVTFLNNINFPLQIVIQSRELKIDKYLSLLRQKEKEQINELLKIQTSEYIQYISELISLSKIMNKRFYIIIPYDPITDKKKNFFTRFRDIFKPAKIIKMREDKFIRRKKELIHRVEHVMTSLMSIGLKSVQLDTQGVIELLYNTYNPSTSFREKLDDINKLRVEI